VEGAPDNHDVCEMLCHQKLIAGELRRFAKKKHDSSFGGKLQKAAASGFATEKFVLLLSKRNFP